MTQKKCYDCGLEYGPEWVEAIIPDALWSAIRPDEGGLCLKCTCRRLSSAGHDNVKGFVRTPKNVYGPVAFCCGPIMD